jgi:hypothetical protein
MMSLNNNEKCTSGHTSLPPDPAVNEPWSVRHVLACRGALGSGTCVAKQRRLRDPFGHAPAVSATPLGMRPAPVWACARRPCPCFARRGASHAPANMITAGGHEARPYDCFRDAPPVRCWSRHRCWSFMQRHTMETDQGARLVLARVGRIHLGRHSATPLGMRPAPVWAYARRPCGHAPGARVGIRPCPCFARRGASHAPVPRWVCARAGAECRSGMQWQRNRHYP